MPAIHSVFPRPTWGLFQKTASHLEDELRARDRARIAEARRRLAIEAARVEAEAARLEAQAANAGYDFAALGERIVAALDSCIAAAGRRTAKIEDEVIALHPAFVAQEVADSADYGPINQQRVRDDIQVRLRDPSCPEGKIPG